MMLVGQHLQLLKLTFAELQLHRAVPFRSVAGAARAAGFSPKGRGLRIVHERSEAHS